MYNVRSYQFSTFLRDKKSKILIHLPQPKIQSFASITVRKHSKTTQVAEEKSNNEECKCYNWFYFVLTAFVALSFASFFTLRFSFPFAAFSSFTFWISSGEGANSPTTSTLFCHSTFWLLLAQGKPFWCVHRLSFRRLIRGDFFCQFSFGSWSRLLAHDGWGPVSYTHLTLPTIYSV